MRYIFYSKFRKHFQQNALNLPPSSMLLNITVSICIYNWCIYIECKFNETLLLAKLQR